MNNEQFTLATIDDIKTLHKVQATSNDRHTLPLQLVGYGNPISEYFEKTFNSKPNCGYAAQGVVISRYSANEYYKWNQKYGDERKDELTVEGKAKLEKLPYLVRINSTKNGTDQLPENVSALAESVKDLHFLGSNFVDRNYWYHDNDATLRISNIALSVEVDGVRVFMVMPCTFAEKAFGLTVTPNLKLKTSNGTEAKIDGYEFMLRDLDAHDPFERYYYSSGKRISTFDYTINTLESIRRKFGFGEENLLTFIKALNPQSLNLADPGSLSGIKKSWTRLAPIAQEVLVDNPIAFCSYRTLAQFCAKSVDSVKVSSIFNDVFEKVQNKADFLKALSTFYGDSLDPTNHTTMSNIESAIKKLDVYKQKRKAVLKGQAGRAFAKIQQEADNLTIDKVKYKRTWAEIEAGNLGIGTFFRKSEQYFLLNDNWDLWEEMFKRGLGEQAIELANEVKGRTTYEKDLMSYFYFVLYGLPEYLKKQTGHKWTCIPKLVNSSSELEPPKEGEDGVARTRSALTPHVDNETHTVTVPYASLAIGGGYGTTYCYSHDYHVLHRGMSFGGYAVTKDVEEKLNGRDNYGLMFYTLTGSANGRGYPTFLIIFEQRERFNDVRVHFHRTHPFRSKDGDYNPIHQWTKGCYNWMAGNIKSSNIKAQQGDLFFVQVKTDANEEIDGTVVKDLAFDHKVNQYDKHCFEREVPFAEYKKAAKANILGYVNLEEDTWLKHTEHDDVLIPKGTYAIHQCRSWEANPKGVWSLRID